MIYYKKMERKLNYNNSKKPMTTKETLEPLILPLVTAVGAFGGFPEPPNTFKKIIRNKVVQYFLLFLLIWQGGGGQDWKLSAKVTVIIFLMFSVIKMFSSKKENFNSIGNNTQELVRPN